MNALDTRKSIQTALGVAPDGSFGPFTRAAIEALGAAGDESPWPPTELGAAGPVTACKASSFADPADLAAYNRAIAEGKTQQEAFKVGDNCIGAWGDFTGDPDGPPMCALPPEIWMAKWGSGAAARGKLVAVTHNGQVVIAQLRDTMPHLANIENGAGLDMNPALVKAFGLQPPVMVNVTWAWV